MNRYISKSYTRSKNTLYRAGAAVVSTITSLRKVLTVEIYSHTVNIEKISIYLNRGREESVGNDDVCIVCAHKYEMVRMT